MPDLSHLAWPFFADAHRAFAPALDAWAKDALDHDDIGSIRSNVMNVIDSNNLERDGREKPVPTFSHPALDHDDIGSIRSNVVNVIDSNRLERDCREKPVPTFSHPARAHADHADVDATCRALVRALGEAGWLKAVVPAAHGGMSKALDVRTLCLAREILAWHDGLADFAFAMQGLGTGSISLFGSEAIQRKYLPPVREGRHLAAFALSEPEAGSDVSALAMTAKPDGASHVRLDGMKTWISNGGIADHYVVFARSGEAPGAKGLSAFVVDTDAPGLSVASRIEVIAPHPLATLRFEGCRVPVANRLGAPGEGFKVAMATLDIFRSTVGAAALGFAKRAQDEALARANKRMLFGAPLGDLQLTQAALADSATDIDAATLLIYRAAHAKDTGAPRITRESSMAKLFATEMAQRVIDRAVQLFGGHGVRVGVKVEALYREIRALRIYEGASEVQKVIIARDALRAAASQSSTRKGD